MNENNVTHVTEFTLLAVTNVPELKAVVFAVLLTSHLLNLVGNMGIIVVVTNYTPLHTPMYFFLANLSMVDIGISVLTLPKMMANLVLEKKIISFEGCLTQLFFLHVFGVTECIILVSMSYDRYVAICHPLRYVVRMNQRVCMVLASSSWSVAFLQGFFHIIMTKRLPFCASNNVSHFFCDFKPLFKLVCADTTINELLVILINGFVAMCTFFLILTSYIYIGSHILKIKSSQGRKKAFSTCVSHIIVVVFFLGTATFIYARPPTADSLLQDRMASIMYSVVTPTLNPFVYTLRNKEVKRGIWKIFGGNRR